MSCDACGRPECACTRARARRWNFRRAGARAKSEDEAFDRLRPRKPEPDPVPLAPASPPQLESACEEDDNASLDVHDTASIDVHPLTSETASTASRSEKMDPPVLDARVHDVEGRRANGADRASDPRSREGTARQLRAVYVREILLNSLYL